MSFTIQPVNPENYITINDIPSLNDGIVWIRLNATCNTTGNTAMLDALTGEVFQYLDGDVVLDCLLKGTDIVGGGTLAVVCGETTTVGGAIIIPFITTQVQDLPDVISDPTLNMFITPARGFYMTINLAAGVTAGNFTCLLMILRY